MLQLISYIGYFNPLPPHGGRPRWSCSHRATPKFQSTPSAWRETSESAQEVRELGISIHSLRMEGDDSKWRTVQMGIRYFNPLPPHGGRRIICMKIMTFITFQSTPSAWRETAVDLFIDLVITISIHSLRMEGDGLLGVPLPGILTFQSTPSAWRETEKQERQQKKQQISIHSLRMEGDRKIGRLFAS